MWPNKADQFNQIEPPAKQSKQLLLNFSFLVFFFVVLFAILELIVTNSDIESLRNYKTNQNQAKTICFSCLPGLQAELQWASYSKSGLNTVFGAASSQRNGQIAFVKQSK